MGALKRTYRSFGYRLRLSVLNGTPVFVNVCISSYIHFCFFFDSFFPQCCLGLTWSPAFGSCLVLFLWLFCPIPAWFCCYCFALLCLIFIPSLPVSFLRRDRKGMELHEERQGGPGRETGCGNCQSVYTEIYLYILWG